MTAGLEKTDAPPTVKAVTLRNVACQGLGTSRSTVIFTRSGDSELGTTEYTHCKTQIKSLTTYEVENTDGWLESMAKTVDVKQDISIATLCFPERGGFEVEFEVDKKSGLWTAIWQKPANLEFPVKCTFRVSYTLQDSEEPWERHTQEHKMTLTDPEQPAAQSKCCVIA